VEEELLNEILYHLELAKAKASMFKNKEISSFIDERLVEAYDSIQIECSYLCARDFQVV